MTDLDSILKSRDIILSTKVHLVKAMLFPVVMYGCEILTVKKAECQRIDAFELCCWRRLLRVPWTARRSNQSILKEISPREENSNPLQYIAWRIPWTKEPGRLQFMGSQRVGHNWATHTNTYTHIHTHTSEKKHRFSCGTVLWAYGPKKGRMSLIFYSWSAGTLVWDGLCC